MDKNRIRGPDYEALRKILEKELGRRITKKEAKRFGEWLIGFYAHLSTKSGTRANADWTRQFTSDTTSKNNK